MDGLKTGYTSEAGRNLVATAQRGDMRLISVVMGVEPMHGHFTESMKLLNYGFNNFSYQLLWEQGAAVCGVPVLKGTAAQVDAVTGEAAGFLSKAGLSSDHDTAVNVPEYPQAPVAAGQQLGELQILRDGQVVRTIPLLAAEAVPKIGLTQAWRQILGDICGMN